MQKFWPKSRKIDFLAKFKKISQKSTESTKNVKKSEKIEKIRILPRKIIFLQKSQNFGRNRESSQPIRLLRFSKFNVSRTAGPIGTIFCMITKDHERKKVTQLDFREKRTFGTFLGKSG